MSNIESVSNEKRLFPPPPAFAAQANVTQADADRLNAEAAADYEGFWAKLARETLAWHKPFSKALDELTRLCTNGSRTASSTSRTTVRCNLKTATRTRSRSSSKPMMAR